MPQTELRVRPPHFADDLWYSSMPPKLQQDIAGYLQDAPPSPPFSRLMGLVAPHAGHLFSGRVAGAAFAGLAPGAFETVILIGPDHHGAAPGQIATVEVDAWSTPLGDLPVAWEVLEALQANMPLRLLARDREHALEIELPFLQVTLGRFRLAPLMMGDQSPAACRHLGQALVKALTATQARPALLVASSDLSHYFDDETARQLDRVTVQFILTMDADGLVRHVEAGRRRGEPLACGAGPIAAMIHAAAGLGATQARLIQYATSADVHPRKDQVVGYAAVAIGVP